MYFRPISLQLEVGPKPHPEDADGSVTPTEGPWKSIATLQAPSRKPSLLSKLTLAPAIRSYSTTASFTASISSRRDTNTVTSSANAETLAAKRQAKGIPRSARLVPSSLCLRRRGSDARTWRRGDRGQPCRTERSIPNPPERLPFTCTTAWGLGYIMLIHLRNSGLNPEVSKTVPKNRWSTLSKALDWSKLISAASVSSFIPSRTLRIKCRLSWIDLPFTAKVCSGPIRSLMTSCKRFAKTRAKIFNSVLSRVMGL